MMLRNKLGYYSHILPAWRSCNFKGGEAHIENIEGATVFDCRNLPIGFVHDTGHAVFEDLKQAGEMIRLPFDGPCYFEFSDKLALVAEDVLMTYDPEVMKNRELRLRPRHEIQHDPRWSLSIDFVTFAEWDRPSFADDLKNKDYAVGSFLGLESKPDDSLYPTFYHSFATSHYSRPGAPLLVDSDYRDVDEAARRLCAVLSLLEEKLLASEFVPDPEPKLTRARKRMNRPPKTGDSYVLTINVAAVRRVAKPAHGTHESPALHWRRGHPRVLHRGSEFESKVWVNRCLVGDPERGYINKDYRLILSPTMLRPAELQP